MEEDGAALGAGVISRPLMVGMVVDEDEDVEMEWDRYSEILVSSLMTESKSSWSRCGCTVEYDLSRLAKLFFCFPLSIVCGVY